MTGGGDTNQFQKNIYTITLCLCNILCLHPQYVCRSHEVLMEGLRHNYQASADNTLMAINMATVEFLSYFISLKAAVIPKESYQQKSSKRKSSSQNVPARDVYDTHHACNFYLVSNLNYIVQSTHDVNLYMSDYMYNLFTCQHHQPEEMIDSV